VAQDSSGSAGRRGAFLGFVAHEVRNPLSTALWSAELLTRMTTEDRGGPRGEKLSGMCLRSIARVRQLVEDLFLCERLDAGGIPFRPEPLSAREVIETIVSRPGGSLGEVAIEVGADVVVQADRALLERAIEALLAVAGSDGARSIVGARAEENRVVLSVAGHLPAEGALALEDPVKGSPTDPRGRALALPLVRRIAAVLGGALAAGEAGYTLSLPRAEAYAARPEPAAHP
jgi:K+-sensing histidine kinase KdpD